MRNDRDLSRDLRVPTEIIVFSEEENAPPWSFARTVRAVRRLGRQARVVSPAALSTCLVRARGAVWLLRAGAVPFSLPRFRASATGKPLLALGATKDAAVWVTLLARTGGDLSRAPASVIPEPCSILLERTSTLAAALDQKQSMRQAVATIAPGYRTLALGALDVSYSRSLRVLVAVTTLHRGGAERVAVDLAQGLPTHEIATLLAVLDEPQRQTISPSPRAIRVYEGGRDRATRAEALVQLAEREGVDVVSAHLLDSVELDLLASRDVPTLVTLHNARAGWPEGTTSTRPSAFVACSRSAAKEARAAKLLAPVRVAFNGVALSVAAEHVTRESLGIDDDALVLIAVANPRPQKRLEKAVSVLVALVRRGLDAHLVIVGAPLSTSEAAAGASRLVDEVTAALGLATRVHRVGSTAAVSSFLACADVMLSTSAWEGMSLAQLEALAMGLPVVASDVGGAEEIARAHPGRYVRVSLDASDAAYADAVVSATEPGRRAGASLAKPFTSPCMVKRYAHLLERTAACAARPTTGPVWLVTNNFSTGGAQSSARRLLLALRDKGVDVRAAVLQEDARDPTAGLRSLISAGVEVFPFDHDHHDPAMIVGEIARAIDRDGAHAVLLWNAIAEYKVLLADALMGVRVFDVSPGEMFFASLARYFGKPREDSPILDARDYGSLLAGVVVKYEAEAARAAEVLKTDVHVIANGVHVPLTRPARRPSSRPMIVGTLARISFDKRLDQLLEATRVAMASHGPPFELHIAGPIETGEHEWARELEASCADLPVRFVGDQSSPEFLSTLDVFAMVSEPMGCPNASLEAMAAGLPVVATDVGGARDQLQDGAGILVPRGDTHALGSAIARVLADSTLRSELSERAFARVKERFSIERMAEDYARLLGLTLS